MRKMATIRKIDSIRDIPGADSIECCTLGGWNVVTRKCEYTAGDLAVYCEIDSWIPHEVAPFLSRGNFPHVYNEVKGERLRTVKLRGQLSQGLLLPLSMLTMVDSLLFDGLDVSFPLGIVKYEAPIPAALQGEIKGMFPSRIPKTDQERIQNLSVELAEWCAEGLTWEVTEKLDGSSMTVYVINGDVGVCSRNLDLKPNPDNSLWRAAYKHDLPAKLANIGRNIAVQGELIGNGIQGNMYKMRDQDFYVYDIYDIDAGRYFTPAERRVFSDKHELNHCPVIAHYANLLDTLGITNMDQILKFAEGKSVMGNIVSPEREGLVFKCNEKQVSFKSISNAFLLREK